MLTITIPGQEMWNETTQEFFTVGDVSISLEHSLLSLSKWESKFQKPFLGPGEKSKIEIFEYIKCMLISPGVTLEILSRLSPGNLDDIHKYIESSQSATTFGEMPKTPGKAEIITSEVIYYWMVAFRIPFECESWHINRLFSLVRICNIKNSKPKTKSRSEMQADAIRRQQLNAQRKAQMGSRG